MIPFPCVAVDEVGAGPRKWIPDEATRALRLSEPTLKFSWDRSTLFANIGGRLASAWHHHGLRLRTRAPGGCAPINDVPEHLMLPTTK